MLTSMILRNALSELGSRYIQMEVVMENHFNAPAEAVEQNIKACHNKATLPLGKMILLGIMAGAFIAIGGATSNTAVHNIDNVGLARVLAGAIFPVGLMMIVFVGGELFTGNGLIIMCVLDKRATWKQLVRNLVVVYFSNLIGALLIDCLILLCGNLDYSNGLLGAYTIKVAVGKVAISPLKGFTSGILCNILVCLAILMATTATDIEGKVWAIFFPIWAFVVGGFEHCVANMFYIPAGIMAAANPAYAAKAQEVYGITQKQLDSLTVLNSLHNFIPVTLGNLLGGMLFVGIPCFLVYKRKWAANK